VFTKVSDSWTAKQGMSGWQKERRFVEVVKAKEMRSRERRGKKRGNRMRWTARRCVKRKEGWASGERNGRKKCSAGWSEIRRERKKGNPKDE
jgi:hypothetical protein